MKKHAFALAALPIAAGLALSACGTSVASGPTPVPAPVTSQAPAPQSLTWGDSGSEDGAQVTVSKPQWQGGKVVFDVVVGNLAAATLTNVNSSVYADGQEVDDYSGASVNTPAMSVAVPSGAQTHFTVRAATIPTNTATFGVQVYVNHGSDAAQDRLFWSGPVDH